MRLSVGVEDIEDLRDDLRDDLPQALAAVRAVGSEFDEGLADPDAAIARHALA